MFEKVVCLAELILITVVTSKIFFMFFSLKRLEVSSKYILDEARELSRRLQNIEISDMHLLAALNKLAEKDKEKPVVESSAEKPTNSPDKRNKPHIANFKASLRGESVDFLAISSRSKRTLERNGLYTVGDVIDYGISNLIHLNRMGIKGYKEVVNSIGHLNLHEKK